ncbi:MAG: phosphotransferase family protein [Proteobacteria bacterium]|nr:phosphotransferase family protein [Pseudomonadota bacterium]
MNLLDQAAPPRPGEELDLVAVEAFLKDRIPGLEGTLIVSQFPSGHSNLTYLLAVGDRKMVLRRPPFGYKARSAHDMGREYRVLEALHPVFPYAPRPLAFGDDLSIMGEPFYVMERVKGIILRRDLPPGLTFSPDQAARLCENLLDVLVEFQTLDYVGVGLGDLGRPEGYVARQVAGTCKRYRAARTPDVPDCEAFMDWLTEKQPPDTPRPALIHNDLKFDNVVLDPDDPLKIIGILDWELTTIGDPLMDLGIALSYWVQPGDPPEMELARTVPTNLEGMLTREEMVRLYERKTSRQVGHFDFYYLFGLFRMLVVVQQMYYRYYQGQTKDQRFKDLHQFVSIMDKLAREVMSRSDL